MSTPVRYFGKYELRERLGQGGMAEVWKAFDPQLKRFVAIKYLHANMQADPHILTRFTGEAQTSASCAIQISFIFMNLQFLIPTPIIPLHIWSWIISRGKP